MARTLAVLIVPNDPEAMLTTTKYYLKLKRQAKRLMLNGDVERYMRTLRELQALRPAPPGAMA